MAESLMSVVPPEQARAAALALAGVRAAIGVSAVVAPKVPLRPWVGAELADRAGARLLGRTLGGRDLALGAGALLADRRGAPIRGWVEAGALADACDLLATVLAYGSLPRRTRLGVLALIAGAVGAGLVLAPLLDAELDEL